VTLSDVSSIAPGLGVLIGQMEDAASEDLLDFDTWYISAFPRLVGALYLVGGDWSSAEDAANEACVRVAVRWSSSRQKTNLDGWAFVVGRNYIRRQAWRKKLEIQRSQTAAAVAGQNDGNESDVERLDVVQLLRNLPTRQRDIAVLHYMLDLPQEEVARRLRITRSTVASTVRELREKFSFHIDEE
jgi:RNA polymerase sigma-70 factor (ECF subfamily)